MTSKYPEYKQNGTICWEEFDSDQLINQKKVVCVKNSDFIYGTLRITVPCAIKLCENIVFHPNNGDCSNPFFEPSKSLKKDKYTSLGYTLGFFAAIAIESSDIIIDLNSCSIKQSPQHYLFQRFYAHIELAGQPFLPKQGPANFGDTIKSGDRILVQNGKLGRTSHHCIHGNNNKCVDICRVYCCEFEVAGIALNGCCHVNIKYCDIDGDIRDVPVLGIFSAAIFLRQFAQMAIDCAVTSEARNDLTQKLCRLNQAINYVKKDVALCSTIGHVNSKRDITRVFVNKHRMPDGTSYGILINGHGVAVNSFAYEKPETYKSTNIKIIKTCVRNIVGFTNEVIALSQGDSSPNRNNGGYSSGAQTDTAGSVFQILEVLNNCDAYSGNVVSDMQLALARWSDKNLQMADPELVKKRDNGQFGTLSIHPAVVAWGRDDVVYKIYDDSCSSTTVSSSTPFSEIRKMFNIDYIGNSDSMFHVAKGFFGIRCDSAKNVFVSAKICNVANISEKGSLYAGPYSGGKDGGHYSQGNMLCYTGADSYGAHFSSCENVNIKKSKVSDIVSKSGSAIGVDLNGETTHVNIKEICIMNIVSFAETYTSRPNKVPIIAGLKIYNKCDKIDVCCCSISGVRSKTESYIGHKCINDAKNSRIIIEDDCGTYGNNLCDDFDDCNNYCDNYDDCNDVEPVCPPTCPPSCPPTCPPSCPPKPEPVTMTIVPQNHCKCSKCLSKNNNCPKSFKRRVKINHPRARNNRNN